MIDPTAAQPPAPPLPVTPIPHLEEFCQQIGIGQPARKLLRSGLTPWAYLGLLLKKEKYSDAIRFLAHSLPKRAAVWWACLCLRLAVGSNLGPKQTQALRTAVLWVREPTAANALAAEAAAKTAGLATPAGCLAMSVFWTGQSLTPPDQPALPPDQMLTANTLNGVILMAAATEPKSEFKDRSRRFLAMGIGVSNREMLWSPS